MDIDIDHGLVDLHVTFNGDDLYNIPVYLFTESGKYLGRYKRTDEYGHVEFLIPANSYKFRVDYNGAKYWSDVVNIIAHDQNDVELTLDQLALNLTNDPNPIRFDGSPPIFSPEEIKVASIGSLMGILSHSIVANTPSPRVYYYLNDHLGTPQVITDENGEVTWKADYKPFGETTVDPASIATNNFRFPGQYYDQETGTHYNYLRDYFPGIGRYLETDPIGLIGGINLFCYAGNNPITNIDEEGLKVFYHGHIVNKEMQGHLDNLSNYSGYDIHITSGTRNKPEDNPKSQHFTGNAADYFMTTPGGTIVNMGEAAYRTADYGGFTGIGYYSGDGRHGAHIHADLRSGEELYWSETDYTGYKYGSNSEFWRTYFSLRNIKLYHCR